MIAHASGTAGFPSVLHASILDHGALGVQVFFVISGFLITTLLLEEKQATGTISLRLFYLRRVLRIFPAFYCFFLIAAALQYFALLDLPPHSLLYAATYTVNYEHPGTWWTGHLWSLSVEEQFYLVWPALMLLIRPGRAIVGAAAVAVLSPVLIAYLDFTRSLSAAPISMYFPFVADGIATGCVLAGALPWFRLRASFKSVTTSRLGLLVPFVILAVDFSRNHPRIFLPCGQWMINLGIAYCIARWTTTSDHWLFRLLNSEPLVVIGILSYSLYLWQQPVLNRYLASPVTTFPLNMVLSFVMATVSYMCVERPFLRIRKRFQPSPRPLFAISKTPVHEPEVAVATQ